jgi:hypothetical protein
MPGYKPRRKPLTKQEINGGPGQTGFGPPPVGFKRLQAVFTVFAIYLFGNLKSPDKSRSKPQNVEHFARLVTTHRVVASSTT